MKRKSMLTACAALVVFLLLTTPGVQAQNESETAEEKQIIVSSIRDRGFTCKDVSKMELSEEGMDEGRKVWIVQCESGTYKVSYMGDAGFTVSLVE